MDELFPERFQGVNPNRGIEGSLIDSDRSKLRSRMRAYLNAKTYSDAKLAAPILAEKRARYSPEDVWEKVRTSDAQVDKTKPLLIFPFDQRWVHYEPEHKLLNEARAEFGAVLANNEFLITVPEPRKISETRPVFSDCLVNLHVHERGSVVIPREVEGQGLFAGRLANIAEPAWNGFRGSFGLSGRREDDDARKFVGELQRAILALLHAPAYQADHKSALSADWAHPPIPRDHALFIQLAQAGDRVAGLLNANAEAGAIVSQILGEPAVTLGALRRVDGAQVRPQDLEVSISYWGGAKGRWIPRDAHSEEISLDSLGERTGDLYINEQCYFANVPSAVWQYQLGGYPVIKKWLGYRQADRRNGNPLTLTESKWLRSVVQRIAALLAYGDELNSLYAKASEVAFTAEDLGIRK